MSAFADTRRERGQAIAELFRIEKKGGKWSVPSQKGRGHYSVALDGDKPSCTCDDFAERGEPCKHVYAAQAVAEGRVDSSADRAAVPAADRVRDARPVLARTVAERPTYRQDWLAYNLAQTREKAHVQTLLADLCRGVADAPRKAVAGRKRVPLRDLVFAATYKVYSTVSGRRFQTDLDGAHASGYLSRPVRYNTVFEAFDNPDLTPVLRRLIVESSKPLAAVETTFAIDSSGFGTSRYARWYDAKYGDIGCKATWMKCHLVCGTKTNIVAAVDVADSNSGDATRFVPLLMATARTFTVDEITADGAYGSYDNHEAAARLGAVPFIAFKSSMQALREGVFRDMFHYYSLRREEFLAHYHRRSNVESTFSMVKAKFGADLRSRTETAMTNEALAKVLCHNLCCVIQSHYELGVAVTFWGEAAMEGEAEDATPINAFAWI